MNLLSAIYDSEGALIYNSARKKSGRNRKETIFKQGIYLAKSKLAVSEQTIAYICTSRHVIKEIKKKER